LNLFVENLADCSILFSYFIFEGGGGYTRSEVVEISPNARFTSQINFADLPDAKYWSIEIFRICINGQTQDHSGEFAFRLTEHPLGFPRNE
jgi:hypothetical protein